MESARLKVGIIGAGRIGHIHAQCMQAVDTARLAGVVDVEPQRAEQFAADYNTRSYASIEALLEDREIEAVVICSPTAAHAGQAIQAAEAGKHILCEKPIATTVEDADQMIETAERAGVIFMVGHVLRLMPEYKLAYQLLTGGEIGQVRTMYGTRMSGLASQAWQSWLLNDRFGLGVFDAQIHDLDFFTWVFGPGRSITSHGWRAPAGGWLHVGSVLVHAEGRWGMAESSFAVPPTYPFTMFLRAIGDQGALEFQFKGESYAKPTARSLMLYPAIGRVQDLTPDSGSPYLDQMEHFVTSVQRDIPPLYGHAADARAVLAVALAAQRSLESGGQPVGLEA